MYSGVKKRDNWWESLTSVSLDQSYYSQAENTGNRGEMSIPPGWHPWEGSMAENPSESHPKFPKNILF